MEPAEEVRLSNELLAADDKPETPKKPKRNGKEALRANIMRVVEKYEIELGYSDTKLKRMNKDQLTKVLAEVMEESVKIDMAKSVGVDPRAGGKVVTLGALRMLHNICATGFEKTFNAFGPGYIGLKCTGFAQSLRHPDVQHTVDECLTEIAAENPEVLEYFDSPYSRLALVWVGVISTTLTKAHVQNLGPGSNPREAPVRPRRGRGQAERKEHSGNEPRVQAI